MRYVIIGGGIAGTTAADEIRKRDADAEVTIIESEHHRLYSRVLLPHYIEERIDREKVFLKKVEWYSEKNIELFLGVDVTKIDLQHQFVETSEGRELPFDKLLITTGGELNLLEEDLRGVSYLRSLDDSDYLVGLLQEAKTLPEGERHGVVYGGGFIALEYLNIFAKHGLSSTVVMRSEGFWSKVLLPEMQEILMNHITSKGVKVLTNEKELKLRGEKELTGVELASGEVLPASILGVGIGLHRSPSLYRDAGIAFEEGVLANEYLETPNENVYTAGDVAQFLDVFTGEHTIQGNWMNATMQGRAVAKTMTGERTLFELVSSYSTDVLEKDLVFIGDTRVEHADSVHLISSDSENGIQVFEKNGATIGAVMIGDVKKRQEITNAIKAKELYVGSN